MCTTLLVFAIRPLPAVNRAATATGTTRPIPKDSNADPLSTVSDQARAPTWKSSTTGPTASSKENQESRSSMPAIQPADSSQEAIRAAGVTNFQ